MVVDPGTLWKALADVEDPELPISITDMGLVHRVAITEGHVRVEMLPTFTGCPALEVITARVRRRLAEIPGVDVVDVAFVFEPAWTITRMSETGRARLRAHGLSVPRTGGIEPVTCPVCGSANTTLDNPFGPTLCRTVYYCRDCRNPIERFKPPAAVLGARSADRTG
ncbi:MAG: 1,2-phenylacetyl-CoA epoxidase subunit PaaD [Armatimonadota bacterium]|nr:1,2-phenylacetyl-CoA epoxidase subunit PaaD [Armatimonadota bacterium]